ncbi:hypothetical protein RUM43_003369 [Polyplax serrata]|uniref:Box C/D snoRNA protein 1 n=1 Tax=Polyplax serrata TaxID=468196 RepID=A0AAN8PFE1_POLSC
MDDNEEVVYNRLGNCEVCGSENAQYTCPRCEIKTCSLDCVKIHKKELECNGDRDKVGFVPISKFTNLTLLSDYRLLEDVSRTIDNCKRNPNKKYTRYNKPLPPHLYRLRKAAYSRGTNLQFLPQHFTRHQHNSTILNFETRVIEWRLELVFCHAENLKIVIEKCSENERLSSVLSNFITFDKCPEPYKKVLKYYHSTGLPGVEVLLKAENVQQQPSFFALDLSSTLRENFEDRIIIEYPIMWVIFKSHKDEFTILDPDMKVDCTLDKMVKGKPFANFMPYTYFDTVTYSKPPSKGDQAASSIHSSAAELRKYFSCDRSDDEMEEEVNEKAEMQPTLSDSTNKLEIPFYENLIKQS